MVKGPSIAVIDIGSNSIKVLVASRAPDGRVTALATRTIDARISAGIGHAPPRLTPEGMARGLDAIRTLLAEAAPFAPTATVLVATSAVRDAQNGADFRELVRAATGQTIRILTGDEEANLIGRGLTCDPALAALRDFYVLDLGGGSLECLAFHDRHIQQAASLQLGCVRLTEKFVPDPARPLAGDATKRITAHIRDVLTKSNFAFSFSPAAVAVGTGGTLTTVRTIAAAKAGPALEQTSTSITVTQLRELLASLGALPLAERKKIPGLPPARADVFPAALVTLITLAEIGGFDAYRHSLFNLRYGLADEALAR